MMIKPRQTGFSLMELMIVIAIVGILAGIAYPAYTASVLKGKRAQGRTALVELLQQQERYLTQRNCYLGFTTDATGAATPTAPSPSTACGGVTASSVPFKTVSNDTLANAAYLMSAGICATGVSIAECVQVIATPIAADPQVGNLTMTSTGVRDCTGTAKTSNFSLCWP
jgi:type IV pilus assembly protein PilE